MDDARLANQVEHALAESISGEPLQQIIDWTHECLAIDIAIQRICSATSTAAIVDVMRPLLGCTSVCSAGMVALHEVWYLSDSEFYREFNAANGMEIITACMSNHPEESDIQRLGVQIEQKYLRGELSNDLGLQILEISDAVTRVQRDVEQHLSELRDLVDG